MYPKNLKKIIKTLEINLLENNTSLYEVIKFILKLQKN